LANDARRLFPTLRRDRLFQRRVASLVSRNSRRVPTPLFLFFRKTLERSPPQRKRLGRPSQRAVLDVIRRNRRRDFSDGVRRFSLRFVIITIGSVFSRDGRPLSSAATPTFCATKIPQKNPKKSKLAAKRLPISRVSKTVRNFTVVFSAL
jgi:hypothetical protein